MRFVLSHLLLETQHIILAGKVKDMKKLARYFLYTKSRSDLLRVKRRQGAVLLAVPVDTLHMKKIQRRIRSWVSGKTLSCHVQGIYQLFNDSQAIGIANFIQEMRAYFLCALVFKSSLIY